MKAHRRPALLATLWLVACQSGPQPYDGVVGYQVLRDKTSVRIVYLAEETVSWSDLGHAAVKVCAQELSVAEDSVALAQAEFEWMNKQVSSAIEMSTSQGAARSMQLNVVSDQGRAASSAEPAADRFVKQLKLKRLSAECLALQEPPSKIERPAQPPSPSPILPPAAR